MRSVDGLGAGCVAGSVINIISIWAGIYRHKAGEWGE